MLFGNVCNYTNEFTVMLSHRKSPCVFQRKYGCLPKQTILKSGGSKPARTINKIK